MSEFSESYHLEADDQQKGIELLQRIRLEGYVYPPAHGWVTIVPRSKFGDPLPALVEANQDLLLHYLFEEDAGWMFRLFSGPRPVSRYECRWLDWGDPDNRIVVDDSRLDTELILDISARHGPPDLQSHLERVLRPRIVRRVEDGEAWDEFGDWMEETDDNVAYAFARVVGLPHFEWFGWRYIEKSRRNAEGAVHVPA